MSEKNGEQHGPGPIGEQPKIGESFVWMRAEPGKWGEQIEQIVDVLGPASRDEDGNAKSWVIVWRDYDGGTLETVVKREGDRWVRAHE